MHPRQMPSSRALRKSSAGDRTAAYVLEQSYPGPFDKPDVKLVGKYIETDERRRNETNHNISDTRFDGTFIHIL